MTGAEYIAKERDRQIDGEGFDAKRDDQYDGMELLDAASCYITDPDYYIDDRMAFWPTSWDEVWFKPQATTVEGRVIELARAGALVAAEIDRLLRL